MERERVGGVLLDDVGVLDFHGAYEVLSVTRRAEEQRREEPSPFDAVRVARAFGDAVARAFARPIEHPFPEPEARRAAP